MNNSEQKANLLPSSSIAQSNMLAADAVKLTPRQNMIIYCLQNGWELITGDFPVTCANNKGQFQFTWSLLMKLVNKGLIRQYPAYPFDYRLTDFGRKFKTKKVDIDNWL